MTPAQIGRLPAILDAGTTARVLGCSEWTVRQMHARGELPALRLGRLLRFRLVDVLSLAGLLDFLDRPSAHARDDANAEPT